MTEGEITRELGAAGASTGSTAEVFPAVTEDPGDPSKDDYMELSKEDVRHNMTVLILLDTITFMAGADLGMALIPLLTALHASNTMMGIATSAQYIGWVGFFFSPFISRRFRYKKWYMVGFSVASIAPILGMAAICLFAPHWEWTRPTILAWVFGMALAKFFLDGFQWLPNQEYLAACIPMTHRGRLLGWSFSAGGVLSIGLAAFGKWILDNKSIEFPLQYGYVLLIGASIFIIGYVPAIFGRERPTPVEKTPPPWRKEMFRTVWENKQWMLLMGLLSLTYITVYPIFYVFLSAYALADVAKGGLGMTAGVSAVIMGVMQAVRIPGSFAAGWLNDKLTARRVLPHWYWFALAGPVFALLIPNVWGVYIGVGFMAVFYVGFTATSMALLTGIPKPEHRSALYTMQFMIASLVYGVGPIILGWLCDTISYRFVFGVAAVSTVVLVMFARLVASRLNPDQKVYG